MKTHLLILSLILCTYVFSQDCPCVKTAIIGKDTTMVFEHNNKVVAMDAMEINQGESIALRTKESTGKITWYSNGKELTNDVVCPKKTTEYIVKSTLDNCPDAYDKVIIRVNAKGLPKGEVRIFPNPVEDFLTISSDNGIRNIEVKNINGEMLLNLSYTDLSEQQSMDISFLPTGVYLIKVELSDGNTVSKEIIKQ